MTKEEFIKKHGIHGNETWKKLEYLDVDAKWCATHNFTKQQVNDFRNHIYGWDDWLKGCEKPDKNDWKSICDEYASYFAKKHDIDINYELQHGYLWIRNEPGTICEMADMFIDMNEIRYDVDNDIPEDKFSEWYWKHLDHYEKGLTFPNYESYCKGCPEPYSKEQLEKIEQAQKRVREAKNILEECIKEYGGDPSKNTALIL